MSTSPWATAAGTPKTAATGVHAAISATVVKAPPTSRTVDSACSPMFRRRPEEASSTTPRVRTRSRVRRRASHPASSPLTTRAPSTHVARATGIMSIATRSAGTLTDHPTSINSRASAVPMPPIVVVPATTSPGRRVRAVTGSRAKRSGASESSALTRIDPIHHPSTTMAPVRTIAVTAASGAPTRRAISPTVSSPSMLSAMRPTIARVTIIQGFRLS